MLAEKTYDQGRIDACRHRVAADAAAFAVVADGWTGDPRALAALEQAHFTALVALLDRSFVHRMRGAEGKDGNALNEVRLLCDALAEHDGVLTADRAIRYDPARSVLGLALGERVRVDADGFAALADAFLSELEARFG